MKTTTLQVPLSVDLKNSAKKQAQAMGFSSLQEFVRVVLTQLSHNKISLDVSRGTPPEYLTPEQEAVLEKKVKEAEEDIKSGRAHSFDNIDDMMSHLNSL